MIRLRRLIGSLAPALILVLSLFVPAPAAAAELTLSTRFPGVTIKPGQKVTISLEIANATATPGLVDLTVVEIPEGWGAPVFSGGGFTVNQVFVQPHRTETVTFTTRVPDAAIEGEYRYVIRAEGPQGVSTLPLTLKVERPRPASARLTTRYPSLQGPAGATYEFRVDLHNDGDTKETFSLAAQAPEGWEVIFHPGYDSKRVATIPVDGDSTESLNVEIKTPNDVQAGTYTVEVAASAGQANATQTLEITILGKTDVEIGTPSGRLTMDAVAGKETTFQVEVKNEGTAPLPKVDLRASTPPGWTVTYDEESLKDLPPGESREVTATLNPDSRAIAGDYVVTLRASGPGFSDYADLRVTVKTSTAWGFVGGGIVVLALGGVAWLFRTYGRR